MTWVVAWLLLGLQDDEAAKRAIAEFRKGSPKTDVELQQALETLAAIKHPRILKELAAHLRGPSEEIRRVAARLIGEYSGDKDAAEALALVLPAEATRATRDADHQVAVSVLRALEKVARKDSAPKIHVCFEHANAELARVAIETAGALGNLDSVEPLIRLLSELERAARLAAMPNTNNKVPPGMVKLPGRPAQAPPKEDPAWKEATYRHNELAPAIQAALGKLTGDSTERPGPDWAEWWSRNKSTIRARDKK
jgi:hypothetical protein